MSKKIIVINILIVILYISLFGCKSIGDKNKVPTTEEVKIAFTKANSLFKMFWGTGLEVDKNDGYKDENNNVYYAVKYEDIKSLNSLKNYLLNVFSPQIVDELMDIGFINLPPRFVEKNNKLYQFVYDYSLSMPNYNVAEKELGISKESNTKFNCVTNKILYESDKTEADGKVYTFNYMFEKVANKWIFTKYPNIEPFTEQNFDYSNYTNKYPVYTEMKNTSDLQRIWDEAIIANGWFELTSHISTQGDNFVVTKDNILYKRVYNNEFKTIDDLKNYLLTMFSEEIVKANLSNKRFISVDGHLYYADWEKGTWFVKDKDKHIEKINEKKYVFKWSFVDGFPEDTDKGKKVYTVEYDYEYINNRWVFTNFPYYSNLINR